MKVPPTPVLRDADHQLIAEIVGRLAHHRTVDVLRQFYTYPAVQQQLADRDSQTRDRIAYMSGLVVAEVSLRRLVQDSGVAA